MRIILASKSPRRKMLFGFLGIDFDVIPSEVDEDSVDERDPVELTKKLARMKAEDVADRIKGESRPEGQGDAIVIGADTLVSFEGKIIGKARDREEAFRVLKGYSGKEHEIITGLCLINTRTGKIVEESHVTKNVHRRMDDREIRDYVSTGEPLEGAGCYTPRAHMMLFREIQGSWTNILGLPMNRFVPLLGEVMREG